MKLSHTFIPGRFLIIDPLQDKNFPRHSAYVCERMEGKKEPIFMAIHESQQTAIDYAKRYGFVVPFGF